MEDKYFEEIKRLAKSHPGLGEEKLEKQLHRLERMKNFYKDKAIDAPEKQGFMFQGFVTALEYAETSLRMYHALAKELNKITEEEAQE